MDKRDERAKATDVREGAGRMPAAHGDSDSHSGIPPQAVGDQEGSQTPLDPGSAGAADASPLSGVTVNHGNDKGQTGVSAAHEMSGPQGSRPTKEPSRENVHRMFDRIAPRYDLLNHLLSFNRDKVWRRRMATLLPTRAKLKLLDLATGTGDQLIALYDSGKVASGVGVDPSAKMLEIGVDKIRRRGLSEKLTMLTGSGEAIPCADKSVDVVTISFGIRNVTDVPKALREIHRVLKSDGRVLILEFSLPKSAMLRAGYLFYFRNILPTLGGIISGDRKAYKYLNQTVETFPYGEQFVALMREAGFDSVKATPLTFGVASIYQGDKR